MKNIIVLLYFLLLRQLNAQAASSPKIGVDNISWAPWQIALSLVLESIVYLLPGLLIIGLAITFKNNFEEKPKAVAALQASVYQIIMVLGFIFILIGAIHIVPLIANLEGVILGVVHLAAALIVLTVLCAWLYNIITEKVGTTKI